MYFKLHVQWSTSSQFIVPGNNKGKYCYRFKREWIKWSLSPFFLHNQVNESRGSVLEAAHYLCQRLHSSSRRVSWLEVGGQWLMFLTFLWFICSATTSRPCWPHTEPNGSWPCLKTRAVVLLTIPQGHHLYKRPSAHSLSHTHTAYFLN